MLPIQTWLHRLMRRQRLPQSSLSVKILPTTLSSQTQKSLKSMDSPALSCRVSLIQTLRSWLIGHKSPESRDKLSAMPKQLLRRNNLLLIMRLLVALTDYFATRSSTKLAKILVFKLLLTVSDQLFTRIVSPAVTAKILSAKPKSIIWLR